MSPGSAIYYDVTKEVTLQCDASQSGVGAALLQEGHPVAFTSRALTSTESPNRKEAFSRSAFLRSF